MDKVFEKKNVDEILFGKKAAFVTFIKTNGETRKMKCTKNVDLSDDFKTVVNDIKGSNSKSKSKDNDSLCVVWDLEKNNWRSFRYDSITDIEEEV